MSKIVTFRKNWRLWSNSVTRQVSFERPKTDEKCQNSKLQNGILWVIYGLTALPDRSILIGQKWMEMPKFKKFKWDILSKFQTMYSIFNGRSTHLPNVIFQEKVKMTMQTSFVKSYKVVICIYRFFRWFFFSHCIFFTLWKMRNWVNCICFNQAFKVGEANLIVPLT